MLHEVLLSLSGHPSPLFETRGDNTVVSESFPLLSPQEKALLSSIGHLSKTHRDLKAHTSRISSSHSSIICEAVASSIQTVYLARFQQKILDVEERILKKDASIVGAYNIVPLAAVVGEFDIYTRLLDWLWKISCLVYPVNAKETGESMCTGPALIDKLRQESQTGYPDIEEAALGLGKVAEAAWLRQLATWVLYGRLSSFGAQDFFIYQSNGADSPFAEFEANHKLLPNFVASETASSILFIGRSLNHIRSRRALKSPVGARKSLTELELLPIHLQYLSELAVPISAASLSQTISSIRISLSENTLQQLLPLPKIIQLLDILREFFLLGRGEFAMSLISEADDRLRSRGRTVSGAASKRTEGSVRGLLFKEAEVNSILSKTWSALSALHRYEEISDENLELARDWLRLAILKQTQTHHSATTRTQGSRYHPILAETSFNDILLSVPVALNLDIPSPFDLFITDTEMQLYSALNSYLLAIRRAHLHLANLWRQSSIRRVYPAPPGPSFSSSLTGQKILQQRRKRNNGRNSEMRKVWASCTAAIFLLSEMDGYFETEVVGEAWQHFRNWISPSTKGGSRPTSASSNMHLEVEKVTVSLQSSTLSRASNVEIQQSAPRDPEVLASAQRRFLKTITQGLLLTDTSFTKLLRTLITHIDELVAYIIRLQTIQQNLDLEEDEGVVDTMANNVQEEKEVQLELDRSRKRVDSDMKAVVDRLRELDADRTEIDFGIDESIEKSEKQEYVPFRGPGVERLLMKLDFARASEDDAEDED
jgi:hypothetical protein